MGLTKNYATTMYSWLNTFAPTFRSPILSSLFDEQNPQPNEYIEYASEVSNFNGEFIQSLTIYSKSTAYTKVMEIADKIENAITEKGIRVDDDWGYITIYKGSPFYQDKTDEDDTIRAGYINLLVRVYQYNV